MEKEKIRFGDLSTPLKTAIIMAWVVGVVYGIAFLVSFIGALGEV